MKKIIATIGLLVAGVLAFAEPVHITVTNIKDICAEDMIYFLAEAEYYSTYTVKKKDNSEVSISKTERCYLVTCTTNGKLTDMTAYKTEDVLIAFNILCKAKGM